MNRIDYLAVPATEKLTISNSLMRHWFFLVILFAGLNFPASVAQKPYAFTPLTFDSLRGVAVLNSMRQQFANDSIRLKPGSLFKEELNLYRARYKEVKSLVESRDLMLDSSLEVYLQQLLAPILKANPGINPSRFRIYFSHAEWPNAYSTGEGTLVFNAALFTRLKNESQVAFVLCHELSHLLLDHSNRQIHDYIHTIYSDSVQEKLKVIKKQEFERNKQLDQLELQLAFKSRHYSRTYEMQADSMAVALLSATAYNLSESLSCLALLDSIDKDGWEIESVLKSQFHAAMYPFKQKWIQKEAAFFGGVKETAAEKKLADSLKTHPDCLLRREKIGPTIASLHLPDHSVNLHADTVFKNWQQQFEFEVVDFLFKSNEISRCLFEALRLLKTYPDNRYLITTIGACWNEIYQKQQEHRLGTIAGLPSADPESQYNRLLEFIQKLTLRDIAWMNYYFLEKHRAGLVASPQQEAVWARAEKYYLQQNN